MSERPGYKLKGGLEYWQANNRARQAGFKPSCVRLHFGQDPEAREQLAAKCRRLTAEAAAFVADGGSMPAHRYAGTLASLARIYTTDVDSPYRRLRQSSQRTMDAQLRIVVGSVGARAVRELVGADFSRWFRRWGEPATPGSAARPARAKHCITAVRALVNFGTTQGWADCRRAAEILSKMRFASPSRREERMSFEQSVAIRRKAREMGFVSIAIATAFAFDCGLRQIDILGWWERTTDGGGIAWGNRRWTGGLLWSDISDDLSLTKKTSKTGAPVAFDLRLCPSILEEISLVPPDKRIGPMVVSEKTQRPYVAAKFSRQWRKIARAAGIPESLQNRDARSGMISEGLAGGGVPYDVMRSAGHTSLETTAIYDRTTVEPFARVARLRLAKREGSRREGEGN